MMKSFVRVDTLKIIDADGKIHVFSGQPGPKVTMRLSDRSLYHKLVFNPELYAGAASGATGLGVLLLTVGLWFPQS